MKKHEDRAGKTANSKRLKKAQKAEPVEASATQKSEVIDGKAELVLHPSPTPASSPVNSANGSHKAEASTPTSAVIITPRAIAGSPSDNRLVIGAKWVEEDAWAWLLNPCAFAPRVTREDELPLAYAPICYPGMRELMLFAAMLGRALTIEDVQFLIRRDGDRKPACGVRKHGDAPLYFYPIRWALGCPRNLREQLKNGGTLQDALIHWAGQFNVKGERKATPVSGSPFKFNRVKMETEYATNSAIYDLAMKVAQGRGSSDPCWTCVPYDRVERKIRYLANLKDMHQATRQLAETINSDSRPNRSFRAHNRDASGSDAYDKGANRK